jgi:hypothetical protein
MRRRTRMPDAPAALLVCPACGAHQPPEALFCDSCRLPLVTDTHGQPPLPPSERHERVRKVKPQLAEGPLVHVVQARNQAEAEFIQGMLLEEGVPSLLRRSAGFDVPDFLAAGPRDVLVPQSGHLVAREILLEAEIVNPAVVAHHVSAARLMTGLLIALAAGAGVVWLMSLIVH